MINRICFSGKMRSGKDFIANCIGFTKLSFAEPIYILANYFFNTIDKTVPGVRELLQKIGQYGNNQIDNENYQYTIERAIITDYIRRFGFSIMSGVPFYSTVNWSNYGRYRSFWVDLLMDKMATLPKDTNLVVTDARFSFELEALRNAGFEHYHIMCSPSTRRLRLGDEYKESTDTDNSERLAWELDLSMPKNRVIWNDAHADKPDENMLSLEQFYKQIGVIHYERSA